MRVRPRLKRTILHTTVDLLSRRTLPQFMIRRLTVLLGLRDRWPSRRLILRQCFISTNFIFHWAFHCFDLLFYRWLLFTYQFFQYLLALF